jgi:hypothetical protein
MEFAGRVKPLAVYLIPVFSYICLSFTVVNKTGLEIKRWQYTTHYTFPAFPYSP